MRWPANPRMRGISGWCVIGLYFCCVLLSALTAILAAIIGIAPYWISPV